MSSTAAINNISVSESSAAIQAAALQMTDIQSIISMLQKSMSDVLQPPTVGDPANITAEEQERMDKWRSALPEKIESLNNQIDRAYLKLAKAEANYRLELQKGQAHTVSRNQLDAAVKDVEGTIEDFVTRANKDMNQNVRDLRVSVKSDERDVEVSAKDDPGIKVALKALFLHASLLSTGQGAGGTVGIGSGLAGLAGETEFPGADRANGIVSGIAGQHTSAVTAAIIEGSPDKIQSKWANFMNEVAIRGSASKDVPIDVNALVQWVLRESYKQNTEDLRFFADKVRFFNKSKEILRDALTTARDQLAAMAGAPDNTDVEGYLREHTNDEGEYFLDFDEEFTTLQLDAKTVRYDADGNPTPKAEYSTPAGQEIDDGTTSFDKAQLEAYKDKLEQELQSVGDDAQLANVDLQNMLQRQQQTLQLMSNISKMLHDTAMAVIRKIGS